MEETNNGTQPQQSSDNEAGCIIIPLICIGFFIFWGIVEKKFDWNGVGRFIGGIAISTVVWMIMNGSTSENKKIGDIAWGIYVLGAFFGAVVSFIKYGLTSWLWLHMSLSWVSIFLFLK
ncbi:hypothetical protein U14_01253 [Candidatus Moduliflexus flocculans]|uniref:Uncharacterized protein n=1 Tax=Candidatus Moduliflexus flocculans TaxID=1499966 RepID=A0A0S6VW45_9BACT|nr:hypothetical protein U14_01253 [Candidatus Moduliflexus flocculans]